MIRFFPHGRFRFRSVRGSQEQREAGRVTGTNNRRQSTRKEFIEIKKQTERRRVKQKVGRAIERKKSREKGRDIVTAGREAVLHCQASAPSGVVKGIRSVHWEAVK